MKKIDCKYEELSTVQTKSNEVAPLQILKRIKDILLPVNTFRIMIHIINLLNTH